ncbi:hypothetical protein CAEBREN_03841 [Caenorhabditis brenneri]|uniref:Decapping nuclease n=1 Tax=Caenorhabditis brenneri TaxID=135651 RepID=G0NTQ4_CAEBE|nr:hypothetical protein CAEBREN_03841 [Caenorhabditis brenneri]
MMGSDLKIYVDTLGYCHVDSEFNVSPGLLPKRLNDNKRFFENPNLRIPFINLDVPLPEMVNNKENNLKSMLDYIRQKGWPNGELPDFVTHKQLLQKLASTYEEMEIYVVKVNGVIFMYRNNETALKKGADLLCLFRHLLTRETEDEPMETDGTVRKGVFNASIDMGDGGKRENILYNGKIDLIDDDDQHNEVKVVIGDVPPDDYFWKERSNMFYWQSFFGKSTHILLGVQKMGLTELCTETKHRLKEFPEKKQIDDGYDDIRGLLSLIREHVKNDGDGFVFSRREGGGEWTIRRNDEAVADFKNEILKNIPN